MQGTCGKDAFVECERIVMYRGTESSEGELASIEERDARRTF